MDEPQSIWTQNPKVIEYLGESVTTEDYDQLVADPDSLCALLSDTINQACESELREDECNAGKRFVAASSQDYCIKEFSGSYFREICVSFDDCGDYQRQGYKSKLRSGPISGGIYEDDKEISRFEVEAAPAMQTSPSILKLKVGTHSQAIDPNNDNCGIVWQEQDPKALQCLSVPAAVSARNMTVPSQSFEWPLYMAGRYLYFELSIENPDVSPVDTGGACCFSRYTVNMRPIERRYF